MEIIGRLKDELVIKCEGGYHYEWNLFGTTSGCFFCEHEKGSTYFDYVILDQFPEVTDEKIIDELISKRPIKQFF